MPLSTDQINSLRRILNDSACSASGAVITDPDGTAIPDYHDNNTMHEEMQEVLKMIYDMGRPVVINTLRSPLSVVRSIGKEWCRMSSGPIPTVLLNGSQLGYVRLDDAGSEVIYEEIAAYPLSVTDIFPIVDHVSNIVGDGRDDVLLFYYPRDWRKGEIIWTPVPGRIAAIAEKYRSAERVYSCTTDILEDDLHSEEICMISLFQNLPADNLLDCRQTDRTYFFTAAGVTKQTGEERITDLPGCSIKRS